MTERRISRITSEHSGHGGTHRISASPTVVAAAVLALEGNSDVTLTVEPLGLDKRLVIAVEGWGFLALERSGDVLQYWRCMEPTGSSSVARRRTSHGCIVMADPELNEFCLD